MDRGPAAGAGRPDSVLSRKLKGPRNCKVLRKTCRSARQRPSGVRLCLLPRFSRNDTGVAYSQSPMSSTLRNCDTAARPSNPPLWGAENSQQPVKRLCIAPRARTSWYVTCLEPPWALLPLEPRVRPLVGHFGLASIGTERTPHRSAYIIG